MLARAGAAAAASMVHSAQLLAPHMPMAVLLQALFVAGAICMHTSTMVAAAPQGPKFSWDTLPTFIHGAHLQNWVARRGARELCSQQLWQHVSAY